MAVKEITDRISPSEIEFDMITMRKHAPAFERVGNVNVYRVGLPWFGSGTKSSQIFPLSKLLFPFLAFFKALSLCKKNKYDATWSVMASYAGFAAMLLRKAKPSIPFILTIQEGDNFERREGIFKPFYKMIFRAADKIQVISNYLAEWSRHMGAKEAIVVVPNGVNYDHFSKQAAEVEKRNIQGKINKNAGDILLITTSRLVPKNAVGDIISSLRHLPDNVKLIVLGTGRDENKLKSLSLELGVSGRVEFLGFVSHVDMPAYLQACDIFIRPSLSEGFGNSFIEAMAAGIPVIATPVGGIVDFLVDCETGLFSEVGNPKSIADQVNKLLSDNVLKTKIIEQAKIMVKEKYDWDGVALEMKEFLLK